MQPQAYNIPHGQTEETLPIHSIPFPVTRGMPLDLWERDLVAPDPARLSASLLLVDSPLPIAPRLLCSDRVCGSRNPDGRTPQKMGFAPIAKMGEVQRLRGRLHRTIKRRSSKRSRGWACYRKRRRGRGEVYPRGWW